MEQFNAIFRENIKRFIAYLLVFIIFFSILFPASVIAEEAQTDPEPEFEFLNGEIIGYNGTETDVVIPETISGETVTAIGNNAFRNKGLTSIIIPNTVKTIGMQAFAQNNLTSIELPGNLTEMGNMAFAKNQLISVILPETLKNIPTGAFYDNQLTSVTIPEGVTHIAKIAFANNQLTSVIIPKSTEYMFSDSFKGNDNINLTYTLLVETLEGSKNIDTQGKTGESVQALKEAITEGEEVNQKPLATLDEVKEVVKKINDAIDALEDESGVKSSIKKIEPLEDIEVSLGTSEYEAKAKLPDKAIIIDSNNQKYKVDVTWLISDYDGNAVGEYTAEGIFELPEGVVQPDPPVELKVIVKIIVKSGEVQDEEWEIEDFTYEDTTITGFSEKGLEKLTENKVLVLPEVNERGEKITCIGKRAFKNRQLTTVVIPEGLDGLIIEEGAFQDNQIEKVFIPEGVKEIDTYAFKNNRIRYIEFPGTLKKIGNNAFSDNGLICILFSKDTEDIAIDNYSFANNELINVTILKKVRKIAPDAFINNMGNGKDNKVYIYTLSEKNKWFDVSDYFKIITLAVESVEELGAIEVDYGTKIDNVNLPKKITLYLNDGEKVEVNVIWTSKDYDGNKAGEYKFIGSYDLPEGMAGEKPEISIKVVVKEELEQPKEPKEPEFPTETERPVAPEMPKKPQKPVQSEETKKTEQPKKSEELKEEISTEEITFVDLDDVPWAKKAIENLAEKGIVVGFGNNEFRPKDKLTRAQFAAILVRAFNIETTTGHSKFDDVKESHWYYEAVMNLANLKIVSGDGTGNFNPNGNITREQMIKLLIEVINIKYPEYLNTKGNLNGFKDSSTISDWAVEYMEKAVGLGLINGFEDSTIRPKEEATRAQAAVIIDRILSLLK